MPDRYVVVGSKSWNRSVFETHLRTLPGTWSFISERADLSAEQLDVLVPRYVFFLHWSWRVPDEVVDRFECIVFHMTDVPYGRGGSPLQNLILAGKRMTTLSAIRMTAEMDAGPVYLKEDLDLAGTAEEILIRSSELASRMIESIVADEPSPRPQAGEVVSFRRRRPEESEFPTTIEDLDRIYDFIRMLDGEGYPPAFLDYGKFRLEFRRSARYGGRVEADVTITERKEHS